jgi:U3 small nucleolar RNA-associated protein 14
LGIRNRLLQKVEDETNEKKKGRKDTKIPNVMISDRRVKTAAKYKISEIPHPFTCREEYERSMQMPLGGNGLNYHQLNHSSIIPNSTTNP